MSRVGKYPVSVPSGVTVQISGPDITVKGKLGESQLTARENVEVTLDGNLIWVKPKNESKEARQMWGTTRALLNNMVKGVSDGFTFNLEINGVGYRAAAQGNGDSELRRRSSFFGGGSSPDGGSVKRHSRPSTPLEQTQSECSDDDGDGDASDDGSSGEASKAPPRFFL